MKKNNSLETIAQEVLLAIFSDCEGALPTLDLSIDRNRLRTLTSNRGIGFISLDLPNLDKMLTSGLEEGALTLFGPLSCRVSKKVRVPKFLSGLWLLVFDSNGCLKDDASVDAIFFLRQISCFGKRLVLKCSDGIIKEAIGDFYAIDESLRPIELSWFDYECKLNVSSTSFKDELDDYVCDALSEQDRAYLTRDVQKLERICDAISITLGYYDPYTFTGERHGRFLEGIDKPLGRAFRHGPGAVSDMRKGMFKYAFPSWPSWLQDVFPFDAFASHNFCVDQMPNGDDIAPSKICDVPKTMDKPRLIASEPVCNQWTQQITRMWIDERISATWIGKFIDLHDQGKSQKMVAEASLSRSMCTVDLSSASDRLSAWSVVRMFRKNRTLFEALRAHRTVYTRDQYGIRPTYFINKFATQGTAVTFPIQSLFFLACALAVSTNNGSHREIMRLVGKVRTFGDDILCPTEGFGRLRNLLTYLQLKVNDDKSFSRGHFRESCGSDCFKGYDVTPVRPKTLATSSPEHVLSAIDLCNNLFKKGLWHASVKTEELLLRKETKFLRRVRPCSGSTGLVTFSGEDSSHLKSRWSDDLQRMESYQLAFVNVVDRTDPGSVLQFFQHVVERPRPDTHWVSGVVSRSRLKQKLKWEPAV
jgi:hypothetical protein